MFRSGLILAGANRVWACKYPKQGKEDGILTAYEISQMDLSKTDLVVLCACKTGLGDLHANEGILGLQRAFTPHCSPTSLFVKKLALGC